jgi:hypothetical protein
MPATVKQYEHGAYSMPLGNVQETADPRQEAHGILFPQQIVEIGTYAIEAKRFGEPQFPIYRRRVEIFPLPHRDLIDRVARNEVAANQPTVLLAPKPSCLFGPPRAGVRASPYQLRTPLRVQPLSRDIGADRTRHKSLKGRHVYREHWRSKFP